MPSGRPLCDAAMRGLKKVVCSPVFGNKQGKSGSNWYLLHSNQKITHIMIH